MHVCASRSDMVEMIPTFFCGLIGLAIVAGVFYLFVKKQDDNKELITLKVKVLEKPIQQGNVEWYVVEAENGERLRLRSFQANNLIIAVGDTGTVSYRGQTIQTFHRT